MKTIPSTGGRASFCSVTIRYGGASYDGDRCHSAVGANHHDIIHKVNLPTGVTQHYFRMFQNKNNLRQYVVRTLIGLKFSSFDAT